MKRTVMMAVSVLLVLAMATPMVLAQGQGGAPEDVDESPIDLEKGAVFGNCDFPVRIEYSGKAKTIELADGASSLPRLASRPP